MNEKENGLPGVNTIVWFKEHEQIFSWFKRKDKERKVRSSGKMVSSCKYTFLLTLQKIRRTQHPSKSGLMSKTFDKTAADKKVML